MGLTYVNYVRGEASAWVDRREERCFGDGSSRVTSAAGPHAPCDSYNIVIAMTVITSRKVFLHNQHYSQFRGEWATGNAPQKIKTTMLGDDGSVATVA